MSQKESIRAFINWLGRNISVLFSLLGILVTIYFAVLYVPSYLKEARLEKIRNINSSLIDTIQDSLYNDQELQRSDIEALIHGKELKYSVSYPYSVDELLVQVEESFYANRFIPYEKRQAIIDKIKILRGQPNVNVSPTPNIALSRDFGSLFTTLGISVVTVLLMVLVVYSTYRAYNKERQLEVEEAVNAQTDEIAESVKSGVDYERLVEAAIKDLGFDYEVATERDQGYDFVIRTSKGSLYVEAKYSSRARLSAAVVQVLPYLIGQLQANVALVTNVPPPPFAIDSIDRVNELNRFKVYVVVANTKQNITGELRKVLDQIE